MNEREKWLSQLCVGDNVIVEKLSGKSRDVYEIERITPTRRMIVNGVRYEPNGFVALGGVWNKTKLLPLEVDVLAS